jgi:hypothetical protein
VNKGTCFVAIPFSDAFDCSYRRAIRPGIEQLGLAAFRADEVYGVRPIIYDIWDGVKAATIVIADVTGRNANVLYELGIAHGVGKPVVMLTQSLDDVPFDLRHLRCIRYDTSGADWESHLKHELVETLQKVLECPNAQLHGLPFAACTPVETSLHGTAPGPSGQAVAQDSVSLQDLRSWVTYKESVAEIVSYADAGRYREISHKLVWSLDEPVRAISLAFSEVISGDEVLFYDLPLAITALRTVTEKSKQWRSRNDHWVIAGSDAVSIAWRQDAAYFFVHGRGAGDRNGFAASVERGEKLIRCLAALALRGRST